MNTNELIEQNIGLAYKLANQCYIKYNRMIDLEDIQSICLVGLVKAAQSFKPELDYAFSTYAYRVMKNEVIHEYKNNIIQPNESLSKVIGDDLELGDTIEIVDINFEHIETKIDNETLREKVNELDDYYKSIIVMTLEKYTRKEIAQILNTTESRINTDYHKAISLLRRRMKK